MKNFAKPILVFMAIGMILFSTSCKKDDESKITTAATLYFTFWADNSINSIDLVSAPNTLSSLYTSTDGITGGPLGIALTNDGYFIYCEEQGNRIMKIAKDGTGTPAEIYAAADGVNKPTSVTYDNATGTIYWCNSGSGQIMKAPVNGSSAPVTLYSGAVLINNAYGIAIDKLHGKLYFADFMGFIKVGNLDGSGTPAVLWDKNNSAMLYPSNICIDVDHNKIYWADETSKIMAGSLDGTGSPVTLYDNGDGVARADAIGIDYNSNLIYWSETSNDVIARAKLDGTGTRQVLVSGVDAYGMVLEFK